MENIIITEGSFERDLLNRFLPISISNTRFINAGSYSSSLSLTKTLLENPNNIDNNIYLVLDAGSIDEVKIKENETFIRNYIGYFENFKLFLIKPEILTLIFESKNLIEILADKSVSEYDLRLGKSNPQKVLKDLGVSNKSEVLPLIREEDVREILNNEQIKSFVQDVLNQEKYNIY